MSHPQHAAEWRAEFERIGESQVGSFINSGPMPEEKRQFGFRWLGEQALARKLREERAFWYARWTFFAAVAARDCWPHKHSFEHHRHLAGTRAGRLARASMKRLTCDEARLRRISSGSWNC